MLQKAPTRHNTHPPHLLLLCCLSGRVGLLQRQCLIQRGGNAVLLLLHGSDGACVLQLGQLSAHAVHLVKPAGAAAVSAQQKGRCEARQGTAGGALANVQRVQYVGSTAVGWDGERCGTMGRGVGWGQALEDGEWGAQQAAEPGS